MAIALVNRSDERRGKDATESSHPVTRSTWRYLPHALLVTCGIVVAPLASVELMESLTGDRPIVVSLLLAIGLSALLASAGSWLWQRRPGSRDMLFGDLMLWGWVRRMLTERRLRRAARLLDGAAGRGAAGSQRQHQVETLERLARALDARDPYTHGHSKRVARNAHMIASKMGLAADQVAKVRVAAAVHDAGKISIDRSILNKPSALTDEEFEVVKRHPGDGADMLAPLEDPEIVAMVRHHHERLDGSGYPDGLAGDEIPLGARIIAVADTFDAITSVRPYRSPRKQQVALKILKEEAGTRLDAAAVAVFLTYCSARRTAAWSSLALAVPERLLGLLSGGAGPIAQGAAATVAAASLGGALVHPVLDTRPAASATAAVIQNVDQSTVAAGATVTADSGRRDGAAPDRRRSRSDGHSGRTSNGGGSKATREREAGSPATGDEAAPADGALPKTDKVKVKDEVRVKEKVKEKDETENTPPTPPAPGGGNGNGNSGPGQSGGGQSNGNSGSGNGGGSGSSGGGGSGSSGSGGGSGWSGSGGSGSGGSGSSGSGSSGSGSGSSN